MTKHKPMRLVGYVRVSTNMQADEGHSVDEQEARLHSYCATYEHELIAVMSDPGASASTLQRPGLQAALAMVADGRAQGLIVTKLDRLTRSVKDLGSLIEAGAGTKYALVSVVDHLDTNTASGRLTLNILVSVSQWEREATGERTKATLKYMKSQGMYLGAVPYGYTLDRATTRLVPNVEQQRVLTYMRGLRETTSLEGIARKLNNTGILGAQGGRWTANRVMMVLRRADSATPAAAASTA